jgi:hypothetical protein
MQVFYSEIDRIRFSRTRLWVGPLLFLLLSFCSLTAQDTLALRKLSELKGKFRFFTTDPIQNLYVVTEEEELIKFDSRGNEQFRYNNFTLGRLGHVDATNPFSLLLYYPDFQAVVLLDRTLNQVGEINLLDLNLPEARAIGLDADNFIWVYDPIRFRLRKLDTQGATLMESENLALSLPKPPEVDLLVTKDNHIFLRDTRTGLFVMNNFGQLTQALSMEGEKPYFQVSNGKILFFADGKLRRILLASQIEETIPLPAFFRQAYQLRMEKDLLFALFPDKLAVFQIP